MDESNLESVMGLIMYGGEAQSNAMEPVIITGIVPTNESRKATKNF